MEFLKSIDSKVFEYIISLASAGGTIAAVLVALRLSRKNDQLRDKQAEALQLLHTVQLLPLLKSHNENIERISPGLVFGMPPFKTGKTDVKRLISSAKEWSIAYKNLPKIESFSIESLAFLPSVPALRISHALALLDATSVDVASFEVGENPFSEMVAMKSLHVWKTDLITARNSLITSIKILEGYAGLENILPKGDEL